MAAKSAISGEYIIQKEESGSIVVYRIYDNSKGALREISQKIGFEYDEKWNVRQFGAKLIDFINENKLCYTVWNLSNKNETSAMIKPDCKKLTGWTEDELSVSGKWFVGLNK